MMMASRLYHESQQRERHTLLCLLSFPCSILLVTVACATIMFAVRPPDRHASSKEAPCCEETVRMLSRIINRTISPCKSVYDFVCSGYSMQETPGALVDSVAIDSAWGYAPSNTPAGKLAYQYYRSCVTAMVEGEQLGAQTAATLLECLGPSLKSPARLIVEIGLRYFIPFPVFFKSENMYHSWHYPLPSRMFFNVYHIAVALIAADIPVETKEAEELYHRIRNHARQTINEALSLDVSQRELEDLTAGFGTQLKREYTASNLTDLHNLIPEFSVEEWRTLLENATGSKITGVIYLHSDQQILKRWLNVLLEPTTQGKSVVFSLVEATSRLLIGSVSAQDKINSQRGYFDYCEQTSSIIVMPLLLRDRLETLNAGKMQDVMLHAYFRSITKAVGERAANLVAPEDVDSVRNYLKDLILILPSEVFRLDFLLPKLTNDYVRNYLQMRDSDWTMYNIPVRNDVPRFELMTSPVILKPAVVKNIIILPINAYAAVNITSTLDAVITFGTIGMLMADAVWRSVLSFNYSGATTRTLQHLYQCLREEKRVRQGVRFHYPTLSLDATLDAARREHWHSKFKFYALHLHEISRSRLFSLLIVFHYYCPSIFHKLPGYRRSEANYLMHRSGDFREAFGCTDRPVSADFRRC